MSPRQQQPLELSPAIFVVLGAVALMGVLRLDGSGQEDVNVEDTKVERVTERPIEFASLGVRLRPVEGWTYLSISNPDQVDRPVFMNVAEQVTVRLGKFGLPAWPPTRADMTPKPNEQSGDEPEVTPSETGEIPVESRQYAQVSIDWIDLRSGGKKGTMLGRLQNADVDLAVTAESLSDDGDLHQALARLFDSLETMD